MRHGRRFGRARLRRRIFIWFGASILVTTAVTLIVLHLFRPEGRGWAEQMERLRTFVSGRFANVWADANGRSELARAIARDIDADVTLFDADGRVIEDVGPHCEKESAFVIDVAPPEGSGGSVAVCARGVSRKGWLFVLTLVVAGSTLWAASGRIARRLTRPLDELVRVTREIGAGKLSTRVRLGRHHLGEVGLLAESINDMSERIERQIADQRELLAAVSHEVRTPLTRLRVLLEMARDGAATESTLDRIEEEIVEIDDLVGQLLASSRMDFAAVTMKPLDAVDLAIRAVERAHVAADVLDPPESGRAELFGDATLLSRALANVLDNADKHGGGVRTLRIRTEDDRVVFEIEDGGPGFDESLLGRVFEPFAPGDADRADAAHHPSLGLGLALVKRIVLAHGGDVSAANRADGGARLTLSLPVDGRKE